MLTFNLRQMDIKQTTKDNVIYFFGQVFSGIITFVAFLYLLFNMKTNGFRKIKTEN